jgi:hypothetical protein
VELFLHELKDYCKLHREEYARDPIRVAEQYAQSRRVGNVPRWTYLPTFLACGFQAPQ